MCGSSGVGARSPMAEFLKSQSPQELWKASLKPQDPTKPEDPFKPKDALTPAGVAPEPAAKAAGTGLVLDTLA